jgi:uncharacterized membrane protein
MTSSFRRFRDFIQKRMRMSHIYQPVMIRELLKSGGKASDLPQLIAATAEAIYSVRPGSRLLRLGRT